MEAPRKSKKKGMSKSGVRTKFLIESLRNEYYELRKENEKLRAMVSDNLPGSVSREILADCFDNKATKAAVNNIDELAGGMNLDDDEDEEA
jgi:hypothetical protein